MRTHHAFRFALLLFCASVGFGQIVQTENGWINTDPFGVAARNEAATARAQQELLKAQTDAVRAQTQQLRRQSEPAAAPTIPVSQFTVAVAALRKLYPDFDEYAVEAARLMPEMDTSHGVSNLSHFLEGMYLIAKNASFSKQATPAVLGLVKEPEFNRLPVATRLALARAVDPSLAGWSDANLGSALAILALK
jgi:hypothetical protein